MAKKSIPVIVDTNVIFSALLNSNGKIGDLLFNPSKQFQFYSCSHMKLEIRKHWNKLKKISKLSDAQLEIAYEFLLSKIDFIDEQLIPDKTWIQSEKLAAAIDEDDVDFIALTKYLKGYLWGGDKELIRGLQKIGLKRIYTTNDLLELRDQK